MNRREISHNDQQSGADGEGCSYLASNKFSLFVVPSVVMNSNKIHPPPSLCSVAFGSGRCFRRRWPFAGSS